MLNNPELSIIDPDVVTIAENIQELVAQCQYKVGVQLNSESVCDLTSYSKKVFDFEIVGSTLADSKLLNLYFDGREIGLQNIKEMILYKDENEDRIIQITLIGINKQIIIFMDTNNA